MIQNLFKISFRLLWRDQFFILLNVGGLAVVISFDTQFRWETNVQKRA